MNFLLTAMAVGLLLIGQTIEAQDSLKSKQLEEVIVTANKREENILKVNTSITSLSKESRGYKNLGIERIISNRAQL